jgi:hypothetical protein
MTQRDLMSDVTLVIPSNRHLQAVENCLLNTHRIASNKGCSFVVCDNSGSEEKKRHLSRLFGSSYIESPEPGAMGNWGFGLHRATTEFVGFVADDDWLVELPEKTPNSIPEDYVCIAPQSILSSPDIGPYSLASFSLFHDDHIERVKQYRATCHGANRLLHGFWRKDLFLQIFEVNSHHPCHAGYSDWVAIMAMLAEGKVLSISSLLHFYRNDNWFGPEAAIKEEFCSLLERAELPSELVSIQPYLHIIDMACFFARRFGYRQTLEKRAMLFHDQMSTLSSSYEKGQASTYLDASLEKIGDVSREAKNRYEAYIDATLDKKIFREIE